MKGKKASDNRATMALLMGPEHANIAGNVHGGVIMRMIDNAAAVCAARHARTNVVTASIDRISFFNPVYVGNMVTLRASINQAGTSSMEIGVRVEAEDIITGQVRHTASAYLTFVALGMDGRPTSVPPLILETEDDQRRNREAHIRRQMRLEERKKEEASQKGYK